MLYANGLPFHIKGVNWIGSENRAGPPLGLDVHDLAWYMQWLKAHKFNSLRLLFNHQMILSDEPLEPPNEEKYGKGAPWEAPELANYRYIAMFKKIAEVAAEHGILVMMAAHRLGPADWPGNGLWYNGQITEARVRESWSKLAQAMCHDSWNVFAVDLQNEPHKSSWAKGDTRTDWGRAAERLGDHVLSQCARWLIFVEGVGYEPGAKGMDASGDGIWWGENLYGVHQQPVSLMDQSKLVYSPHEYGPSVYEQAYFGATDFPNNMDKIWRDRFEFVRRKTGAPVVIGELGGHYTGLDQRWQDWAIDFMNSNDIGLFYFTLVVGRNAQGDDTGGLLLDDWTSPATEKVQLLTKLKSTDVLELKNVAVPKPPPPPPAGPTPPPPSPSQPLPKPPPPPSPPLPLLSPPSPPPPQGYPRRPPPPTPPPPREVTEALAHLQAASAARSSQGGSWKHEHAGAASEGQHFAPTTGDSSRGNVLFPTDLKAVANGWGGVALIIVVAVVIAGASGVCLLRHLRGISQDKAPARTRPLRRVRKGARRVATEEEPDDAEEEDDEAGWAEQTDLAEMRKHTKKAAVNIEASEDVALRHEVI